MLLALLCIFDPAFECSSYLSTGHKNVQYSDESRFRMSDIQNLIYVRIYFWYLIYLLLDEQLALLTLDFVFQLLECLADGTSLGLDGLLLKVASLNQVVGLQKKTIL